MSVWGNVGKRQTGREKCARTPIDIFLKSWSLWEVRRAAAGETNLVLTGRPCCTMSQLVRGSRDTMQRPEVTW